MHVSIGPAARNAPTKVASRSPPMHVSKSIIVDAFCHAGCASRAREYTLAICATERDLIFEMWWGRKFEWEKTDYYYERRHHLVCDW